MSVRSIARSIGLGLGLLTGGCSEPAAECIAGGPGCSCIAGTCDPGLTCIGDACYPSGDDGTADADAESNDGETGACSNEIGLTVSVTFVLLVDQSGSMTAAFGDSDRWATLIDALVGPSGIVAEYEPEVRFGVSLYTSIDGNTTGNECPLLTEVAPDADNFDAIENLLGSSWPTGETPTGESLEAVALDLAGRGRPGAKYILLVTDGLPDTCEMPLEANGQLAIQAAADAFELGIATFVISVDDDPSGSFLQDIANAGLGVQGAEPDAPFYVALDEIELSEAFHDVIGPVAACRLTPELPLSPADAATCSVFVEDTEVPYEGVDGWVFVDGDVELRGAACAATESPRASIRLECPC